MKTTLFKDLLVKATAGLWAVLPEELNRDYIRIRGTCIGGHYKVANVVGSIHLTDKMTDEIRANAELIARCNPSTMATVYMALEKGAAERKRGLFPPQPTDAAIECQNALDALNAGSLSKL